MKWSRHTSSAFSISSAAACDTAMIGAPTAPLERKLCCDPSTFWRSEIKEELLGNTTKALHVVGMVASAIPKRTAPDIARPETSGEIHCGVWHHTYERNHLSRDKRGKIWGPWYPVFYPFFPNRPRRRRLWHKSVVYEALTFIIRRLSRHHKSRGANLTFEILILYNGFVLHACPLIQETTA